MLSQLFKYVRQRRIVVKTLSIIAIAFIGLGMASYHSAPASSVSLVERLDMLRSTSPESGVYDSRSVSFDVAVLEAMVNDVQNMTEDCALASQATDSDLSESVIAWHEKLEETMPKLQETRKALVGKRFSELRSTSPESGVE